MWRAHSHTINTTPLSMAYYAYDSTTNFLSLGPTMLIVVATATTDTCMYIRMYVYQKNGTVKRSYVRGVGNFEI